MKLIRKHVLLVPGALSVAAALAFSCGESSEAPPESSSAGSAGEGAGGARSCIDLEADYASAFDEAASCDPNAAVDQCTESVVEGLACSCGAFANPEHEGALARAAEAQAAYQAQNCSEGVVCGACLEPLRGRCSAAGRCENVYAGSGRGCKVGSKTYADGEGNIPDPVSCNTCTCSDGELACTEIGCPSPCPDGTALGTQCAECGPTDACLVVEHACFPTCVDTCDDPSFCVGGLCITSACG